MKIRGGTTGRRKRLPNDLELPLDGRSKQIVGLVRLKRFAGNKPGDPIDRL